MTFHVAYCMHRGVWPRQQDALLVGGVARQSGNLRPIGDEHVGGVLIALADGVAASPNPHLASKFLVQGLPRVMQDHPEWLMDGLLASRHLRELHSRLCDAVADRPTMHGGASTLVVAHLLGDRAVVFNSGDSRAYLRRVDGTVVQVSRDHTELQRLLDSGEGEAEMEYASMYDSLSDCFIADSLESSFAIHLATPMLQPGDMLVLCTDGVHDELGDGCWQVLVAEHDEPVALVEATRTAVLGAGAGDNFSVIAARYQAET